MAYFWDGHVQLFGVQAPSKLNNAHKNMRRWRKKGTNHKKLQPPATKMQEPLNHQHKKHVFLHFLETFATFLETWFSFLAPNSPLVPLVGSQNEWFLVGSPWLFQAETTQLDDSEATSIQCSFRGGQAIRLLKNFANVSDTLTLSCQNWCILYKESIVFFGGVIWGYINYQLCFSFFRIPKGLLCWCFFPSKNVCASKQLHSRNLPCILRLIWCLANIVQFRSCRARARNTGAFVRGACE